MSGFEPRPLPYQGNALPLSYIGSLMTIERETGFELGDIQLGRLTLYQLSYSRYYLSVGRAGFEPAKVKTNRFTVCPRWPLEYLPIKSFNELSRWRTRTHDLLITNQLL